MSLVALKRPITKKVIINETTCGITLRWPAFHRVCRRFCQSSGEARSFGREPITTVERSSTVVPRSLLCGANHGKRGGTVPQFTGESQAGRTLALFIVSCLPWQLRAMLPDLSGSFVSPNPVRFHPDLFWRMDLLRVLAGSVSILRSRRLVKA